MDAGNLPTNFPTAVFSRPLEKEFRKNSQPLCFRSVVGSETCSTCDAGYHTTEQITPTLTCGAEPDKRVEAHCASTCTPSSGATSGIISDGAGTYPDFQACWWLLSASPGVEISISFQSIVLEEMYDYVLVFQCYDALCLKYTELLRYTGTLSDTSTVYSSTTGFLKMVFYSDFTETKEGFTATWSIGGGEQCCPAHSTAPPGASSPQQCVCDAGYISNTGPGGGPPCTPPRSRRRLGRPCYCRGGHRPQRWCPRRRQRSGQRGWPPAGPWRFFLSVRFAIRGPQVRPPADNTPSRGAAEPAIGRALRQSAIKMMETMKTIAPERLAQLVVVM